MKKNLNISFLTKKNKIPLGHFTVMDGSEADGDLVLIQTFLLCYVNQVILMLTSKSICFPLTTTENAKV